MGIDPQTMLIVPGLDGQIDLTQAHSMVLDTPQRQKDGVALVKEVIIGALAHQTTAVEQLLKEVIKDHDAKLDTLTASFNEVLDQLEERLNLMSQEQERLEGIVRSFILVDLAATSMTDEQYTAHRDRVADFLTAINKVDVGPTEAMIASLAPAPIAQS